MKKQDDIYLAILAHRTTPTKIGYSPDELFMNHTVQLNLNFTHVCRYTRVLARLTHTKVKKLACACTVAHDFGMCTWDSKHMRHTRDTHHKLALSFLHYTCGVTTGTVAVGNEIQLLAADWLCYMS